jgi:translation initiation factor 1 (eIF-1/SUI1)
MSASGCFARTSTSTTKAGLRAISLGRFETAAAALETWLSELKAQLGCGGFVEERQLVLAGDQRQRLAELLEKKGVAKITVS